MFFEPQEMRPKFTLRPARKSDQQQIQRLVWSARLNPTGLDWRRFTLANDSSGGIVACAQIKPHRDGSHEMASLVVDPDYRGQGLARLIIAELIQSHQGDLYLMCRSSLGEFYAKFGFRALGEPEMPPYFRRISKLTSLAEILSKEGELLLIMYRKARPEGAG